MGSSLDQRVNFLNISFIYTFNMHTSKHRQSQIGKLGREALSPQELTSFQDSISSLAASQKDVAGDISSDANALLQLLSQTADASAAGSSQGISHTL